MTSNQSSLTFRFSLDKFVNALAFFAAKGIKDLTKLKAVKLLYFADRQHLFRYGRPIIGDRYIAMDLGPVPEDSFQLISRLIEPAEVADSERERALQTLEVSKGLLQKYHVLKARTAPDLDVFSESEMEVLAETVRELGGKAASTLVDLAHTHKAYKRANANRIAGSSIELPYEYFFEDAPGGAEPARFFAEQTQEDREFAHWLQHAGRMALKATSIKAVLRT